MATAVVMPKQGQSVESCLIVGWRKQEGEQIAEGETLCEVETDKALLEVESPVSGTVLGLFFEEGDEVPVLTNIAAVGEPGEAVDDLRPDGATSSAEPAETPAVSEEETKPTRVEASEAVAAPEVSAERRGDGKIGISPRARNLAAQKDLDFASLQIEGTGPDGRIIERDVQAALQQIPKMTPLARSMVTRGGFEVPPEGSGVSGRILAQDLSTPAEAATPSATSETSEAPADEVQTIPVRGIRKVIAERMLDSLQTTAQLTLNSSADARALLAYRKRLKNSAEELGLQKITINDLILFAVSRILPQYPALNAHLKDETIYQYQNVNLGLAVDTARGLMVPPIQAVNQLSLQQISQEAKRLATACIEGTISPDELSGGTFTVTNLGSLGIESFTPILNPPEVGILGVGNINLKPVEVDGEVEFIPYLGLSLTINHQAVDGAPAARFLQALSQSLADIDLLLAL